MFDEDFFKRMDENHRKREDEFQRLALDPCCIIPNVGDIVVVAAGLLGMGFDYIRLEAKVLCVGQISYKVRFTNETHVITGEPTEKWIHPSLITDVIRNTEV